MKTKRNHIVNFTLIAGLVAVLLVGTSLASAADKDLWPGTKVG